MTDSDLVELDFLSQSSLPLRKLLSEHAAVRAEVASMRRVYEAAMRWRSAGSNPCGNAGCNCTECNLWMWTGIAGKEPPELARMRGGEK